ncbi:carbapenam-3-carboxylate synthase domain-containing protein, partial [Azospirillum sp. sgz302134]
MLYSFIASRENAGDPLVRLADTLTEPHEIVTAGPWQLLVKRDHEASITPYVMTDGPRILLLIGQAANLDELRTLAAIHDAGALTAPPVGVVDILRRFLGNQAFALIEGGFNFVTFEPDGTVAFATDALGLQPVHVVFGRTAWVTSELKLLGAIEPDIFDFESVDAVATARGHADDYTPIRNARRAKPGTVTTLRFDGAGQPFLTRQTYLVMGLAPAQALESKAAKARIHEILSGSVRRSLYAGGDAGGDAGGVATAVPLSGGLDSSLVTALAGRAGGN